MKDEMNEHEPGVDIELTGEDNQDEPLIEDVEANSQTKIKALQAKLKSCEAEKTKHLDDLQRAKADFLNARKRLEDEKTATADRLISEHVAKLLPLCDSFMMAMSNEAVWQSIDEEWRRGVESIHSQLQKLLHSYGVSEVRPTPGEEFDPEVHEAMSEVPVESEEANNTVVSVIQPGFIRTIGEKQELIRPARVTVGVLNN